MLGLFGLRTLGCLGLSRNIIGILIGILMGILIGILMGILIGILMGILIAINTIGQKQDFPLPQCLADICHHPARDNQLGVRETRWECIVVPI